MAAPGFASPSMGGLAYTTRVPTGRSSSSRSSPEKIIRGAEFVSMYTTWSSSLCRGVGPRKIFGSRSLMKSSAEIQDRPVVLQGGVPQPKVWIHGGGVPDHRQHGQIAHAVGIAITFREA